MSREILNVDNFSDVNSFFPVDSKNWDEESEYVQIPL